MSSLFQKPRRHSRWRLKPKQRSWMSPLPSLPAGTKTLLLAVEVDFLHLHSVLYDFKRSGDVCHGNQNQRKNRSCGVAFLPSFHYKICFQHSARSLHAPPILATLKTTMRLPHGDPKASVSIVMRCACLLSCKSTIKACSVSKCLLSTFSATSQSLLSKTRSNGFYGS